MKVSYRETTTGTSQLHALSPVCERFTIQSQKRLLSDTIQREAELVSSSHHVSLPYLKRKYTHSVSLIHHTEITW